MTTLGGMIPAWLHMLRARKGPVLVHRVDGVPKLNRGHETKADQVQPAVNRLTDHTIFQTMFCGTSFAEECGLAPKSWRIIKNAADPRVFFPNPKIVKKDGPLRLVAVSWSSNPRKGFATIADVSRLPGVEVTFVGNWCPEIASRKCKAVGNLDGRGTCGGVALFSRDAPCGMERVLLQRYRRGNGVRFAHRLS